VRGPRSNARIIVVRYSAELAEKLHRQFRMVGFRVVPETIPSLRLATDTTLEAVTTEGGSRTRPRSGIVDGEGRQT